MKRKTKGKREWAVVVDQTLGGAPVYIGVLDGCGRQGVLQLANATRFTEVGAKRVLAGYPMAVAEERGRIVRVP